MNLTDKDCPNIDKDKKSDVCKLLQRKKIRVDVIGYTLRETVYWVKGVACIWSGRDPFVMRFMQDLVQFWVVQTPVDQIDKEIGKPNKERELEKVVPGEWCIGWSVVELGEPAHFTKEKRRGENSHKRNGQ